MRRTVAFIQRSLSTYAPFGIDDGMIVPTKVATGTRVVPGYVVDVTMVVTGPPVQVAVYW